LIKKALKSRKNILNRFKKDFSNKKNTKSNMYKGRYYDETLSEEEDQELIEQILAAPIESTKDKRYQLVSDAPVFEPAPRPVQPETMYQVITQDIPAQTIYTTVPSENWNASLQEPLKPFSEIPTSIDKSETSELRESSTTATENANWSSELPLSQYPINDDSSPEILRKVPEKEFVYTQEISIKYLRPPTPPEHGELLIRSFGIFNLFFNLAQVFKLSFYN
jgi:hypothetical protein